jgi:histone H3/H4
LQNETKRNKSKTKMSSAVAASQAPDAEEKTEAGVEISGDDVVESSSAAKEIGSSSPVPPSTPSTAADAGTPSVSTTPQTTATAATTTTANSTNNSNSNNKGPPSAVEFEPPVACVRRILKKTLPSSSNVGKDAVAAFARASGIFIIYLTACANDFARENRRQTITANDVLAAIKVSSGWAAS